MGSIDELIAGVTDELSLDTTVLLDDTVCRRQLAIDRLVDLTAALASQNLIDLDRRQITEPLSGQHTAGWIAFEERVAPGLAHRRVRTARRLADRLSTTNQAWLAGSINAEHVRVINDAAANLRIGDRICELQDDLIALAGELTFVHWRQMVVYLVRELDEDGAFDPDAELERNHATLTDTIDGDCVLNARFDRVRYHRIHQHIDAKTQELFRHYAQRAKVTDGDLPIPTTACLRALAIYELIEAGAAADTNVAGTHATVVLTPTQLPHGHPQHQCPPDCATSAAPAASTTSPGSGVTADGDSPSSTPVLPDADQAAPSAEAGPDHDRHPDQPSPGSADPVRPDFPAERHDEAGHHAETARRDGDEHDAKAHHHRDGVGRAAQGYDGSARHGAGVIGGWRAWTLDGGALPATSPDLMALLCDATLELLAAAADGRPLALGRSHRLFSPPQRRAMAIRDGGCVFPGCARPASACRSHHVRFWFRDHGPTDVDSGALLCDRDHGIPHRTGWGMFITTDGWTWFRTPAGRTFWGQRHGHQRTGPTPDHPDYVEPPDALAPPAPPVRTGRTRAPTPPARRPTATSAAPDVTDGRAPPGPGNAPPPLARAAREPRPIVIPAHRLRAPDEIDRAHITLTALRERLRAELTS